MRDGRSGLEGEDGSGVGGCEAQVSYDVVERLHGAWNSRVSGVVADLPLEVWREVSVMRGRRIVIMQILYSLRNVVQEILQTLGRNLILIDGNNYTRACYWVGAE